MDLQQERNQVHSLVDQLPPAQLEAVHHLLEVMIDDDELTEEDRVALRAGLNSLDQGRTVSMDEVLADFGLTTADFEKMISER